jgi:hypothetical protein
MTANVRMALSILWLTAKVLIVLFFMHGSSSPFLYQNF